MEGTNVKFETAGGGVLGGRGAVLGGQRGTGYRWASAIDLIYRIKMVVARASGTLVASSLQQNTFCTFKLPPAGRNFKVPNLFCSKLDAMSVPEALATTILIL